jgi:hypothetical protein
LTFAEARAVLATLTEVQFAALDANSDGTLSEFELEAQLAEPTPGCALLEDGASGLQEIAVQIFLFILAYLTLSAMGMLKQR